MTKLPWIIGIILSVSVGMESVNAIIDGAGNGLVIFRLVACVIGFIGFIFLLLKKQEQQT